MEGRRELEENETKQWQPQHKSSIIFCSLGEIGKFLIFVFEEGFSSWIYIFNRYLVLVFPTWTSVLRSENRQSNHFRILSLIQPAYAFARPVVICLHIKTWLPFWICVCLFEFSSRRRTKVRLSSKLNSTTTINSPLTTTNRETGHCLNRQLSCCVLL